MKEPRGILLESPPGHPEELSGGSSEDIRFENNPQPRDQGDPAAPSQKHLAGDTLRFLTRRFL